MDDVITRYNLLLKFLLLHLAIKFGLGLNFSIMRAIAINYLQCCQELTIGPTFKPNKKELVVATSLKNKLKSMLIFLGFKALRRQTLRLSLVAGM